MTHSILPSVSSFSWILIMTQVTSLLVISPFFFSQLVKFIPLRVNRTNFPKKESDQIRSVAQSCPTLCDPMNRSTPELPVHHQLLEFMSTFFSELAVDYPLSAGQSPNSVIWFTECFCVPPQTFLQLPFLGTSSTPCSPLSPYLSHGLGPLLPAPCISS